MDSGFFSPRSRQAKVNAPLKPTTSAEYAAAAHRPSYSVLSNAKLQSFGIFAPRHWKEALAAYLVERSGKR